MRIPRYISIANKVRLQCEKFAISKDSLDYDYHSSKKLACMCAVASYTLLLALRKKGIKCSMIRGYFKGVYSHGESHCWVEMGKFIIDITATQFGISTKVYVVSKKDFRYIKRFMVKSPNMLDSWENQAPNPEISRKILSIKV